MDKMKCYLPQTTIDSLEYLVLLRATTRLWGLEWKIGRIKKGLTKMSTKGAKQHRPAAAADH